ncbi:basic proline-rich protein-like [Hyaena hyaena]|uniref:basic proline-rich protein-like n=1 Tax=Hyaena hyaena TaxID=95912 RepID=UPI001924B4F5|nr:basic proline-rich protein-like [Hyaena hyaena]
MAPGKPPRVPRVSPSGSDRVSDSPATDQIGRETPTSGGCSRNPAPSNDSLLAAPFVSPLCGDRPGKGACDPEEFETKGGRGRGGRLRETRGKGRAGAHSPLLGPDAPVPAPRACRPAGEPPGRRTIRPRSAAVPPGGPGAAGGARGGPGYRGRARPPRGPPARGLAGSPPTPRPGPHPHPGPRRPRRSPGSGPGWTPPSRPSARGRPQAPRPPAPATPAPAPLTLSFSARGLTRAGGSPASHQSERRWQWTRKLGCRCYCSPLGSGESLSLSSKRGEDHIFILETKKCSQGR